jgi:hypothetical protein
MLDFVELSNQTVLGIPCQQQLQNFEVIFFQYLSFSIVNYVTMCYTVYISA